MKENTINEIFYFFALNCVEENNILEISREALRTASKNYSYCRNKSSLLKNTHNYFQCSYQYWKRRLKIYCFAFLLNLRSLSFLTNFYS